MRYKSANQPNEQFSAQEIVRLLPLIGFIVLLLTIVDARRSTDAESSSDITLGDLLRGIEEVTKSQEFCAKNPDHDRCKPATASTLLMRCDSSDSSDVAYCQGSLSAIANHGAAKLPEWRCVPEGVAKQPEQLRLLFMREAHRMPEVLHLPAEQLLYYAVIKAFPCPLRAR